MPLTRLLGRAPHQQVTSWAGYLFFVARAGVSNRTNRPRPLAGDPLQALCLSLERIDAVHGEGLVVGGLGMDLVVETGQVLGARYELVERVGRGGMSVVW